MSSKALLGSVLLLASAAQAGGLDRDGLLTEAPATPDTNTVRVTAGGGGADVSGGSATLNGSVMWTPVEHLAADVGAYFQSVGTQAGPSVRLRYQLLSQLDAGLDLATGARYKSVGFSPNKAEIELLVAAGRRVGRFDLALNAVFGAELGEDGKDVELKGFAGYRVTDAFRVGLDSRIQMEVGDDEEAPVAQTGSDLDLTAGPALSLMLGRSVQLQGLVGIAKPKLAPRAGAIAQLQLSIDL